MPKLSLRDLFAVVTIVALALGWGLDHWRHAALATQNTALRGDVKVLTSTLRLHGVDVILTDDGHVGGFNF